jgi:hypothetical protein
VLDADSAGKSARLVANVPLLAPGLVLAASSEAPPPARAHAPFIASTGG